MTQHPRLTEVLSCRNETGEFFALDLGGTNFRTLYIQLTDDHGGVVSSLFCPSPLSYGLDLSKSCGPALAYLEAMGRLLTVSQTMLF